MSQIVDYDDKELEKLSLYARNFRPMLREITSEESDIDLSNVVMSHYRLSKIRQQDIQLKQDSPDYELLPGDAVGTAKVKDPKEEFLSQIISKLNEFFITVLLTDQDMVNYLYTIKDKMKENTLVMKQIDNNTPEQAMRGDSPKALMDAIMDIGEAHENQMIQLLSNPDVANGDLVN